MLVVERQGRVMGKLYMESGDVVFIEPCSNWEGCHVWKQYHARTIFKEETEVKDKDLKVHFSYLILIKNCIFLH